MGGGGFMQHANKTNKADRAQRAKRREKFNGNFNEKGIVDQTEHLEIESKLSQYEIDVEREKIAKRYERKKWNYWLIILLLVPIMAYLVYLAFYWFLGYSATHGAFE